MTGGVPNAVAVKYGQQVAVWGGDGGRGAYHHLVVALEPYVLSEMPPVDYLDASVEADALHTDGYCVGVVQVGLAEVADGDGDGSSGG